MKKFTILIAGGTGLIGQELVKKLKEQGHTVRILTRDANGRDGYYNWSPSKRTIEEKALDKVEIIINLAGAGIADKRWTDKRKEVLIDSRVEPTKFLFELSSELPELKHYLTASGVNCYGYDNPAREHRESDPYGDDFLSQVVKKWENAADLFQSKCKVSKVRTSTVLSDQGGALEKIGKTVRYYFGSPLGSGEQQMPWISMKDIVNVYSHLLNNELEGTYNALSGSISNKKFTKEIAKALDKPLFMPKVPAFVLKIALGEMSSILLKSLKADNSKLKSTEFRFEHQTVEQALKDIYSK